MLLILQQVKFSGLSSKFVKFQDFFRTMKSLSFFRTFSGLFLTFQVVSTLNILGVSNFACEHYLPKGTK